MSIEAHLAAAQECETAGDLPAAVLECESACLLDLNNVPALRKYGQLLLKSGAFARAEVIFAACLDLSPFDFDALIGLSSLLYQRGELAEARNLLELCINTHPCLKAQLDDARPHLVRVVGFQDSRIHVIEYPDGAFASAIHGGHFSPDHLIDLGQWKTSLLCVLGRNLESLEMPTGAKIVMNTISDPDRENESLIALEAFLARNPDVPVINHPSSILQTTREINAKRLADIPGIKVARTERLGGLGDDRETAKRAVLQREFDYPFIIRATGSQTGDDTVLAHSEKDVDRYFEQIVSDEHYLIQFHDLKREDGLYHKTRVFFIDGQFHPVANLYHDGWSVHSGDRYSVMEGAAWTQEEEKLFLRDPAAVLGDDAIEALKRVADVIDLDFFGIDLTLLDGEVFIFEANASMRHNFDHARAFPYTRPNLEKITLHFEQMVARRAGVSL